MKKITILFLLVVTISLAQNTYTYSSYDFLTGNAASSPQKMTYFKGKIFFSSNFSNPGVNRQLAFCDVQSGALVYLPEINTIDTFSGSNPRYFFEFNNYLYFVANSGSGSSNCELYRTNGATVELVKDLIPGDGSGFDQFSNPHFQIMNNKLYFFARNNPSTGDLVLWQTDGTTENTIVVSEIVLSSTYDSPAIVFNNELYYSGSENLGSELYKYNDITNTVSLVKDLYPGANGSAPGYFTIFNNELFFAAYTLGYGGKRHICKTDGTLAGTTEVLDASNYSFTPCGLKVVNDKLIYVAVNPLNNNDVDLFKCEYSVSESKYQIELVKHFTKGQGTSPLYLTTEFTLLNNELYFVCSQDTDTNQGYVRQIYKTDGTTSGSVKAVSIGSDHIGSIYSAFPTDLFSFNGKLCFSMVDQTNQQQLWISDGSDNYFEKLTNLNANTPNSVSYLKDHAVYQNDLFFTGYSSNQFLSGELWRITDSNALGINTIQTQAKIAIYPNPTSGILNIMTNDNAEIKVTIFDLIGKKVAEFGSQHQIDISNFKSGIYLLQLTDLVTNKLTFQKVIKN